MYPDEVIKRMAVAKARRWANDNPAVVEDLEMAGWVAYLESEGRPEEYRCVNASYAMIDEWVHWRWGRVRTSNKNRIYTDFVQIDNLLNLESKALSVEETVILRDLINKIVSRLNESRSGGPNKLMKTWEALFLTGKSRINRNIGRELGLGPSNFRRVQKLRRIAREILE